MPNPELKEQLFIYLNLKHESTLVCEHAYLFVCIWATTERDITVKPSKVVNHPANLSLKGHPALRMVFGEASATSIVN